MKTERRYCQTCCAETLHDVKPLYSKAERAFAGIMSFGMIPVMDALVGDRHMAEKRHICQRCRTSIAK